MSEIGATLAKDCDFAMIWYYDHDSSNYKVSLRAFHDTMDVSEIAKSFGGGGHRKAAGFVLPKSKHPDNIFIPDIEFEENSYDDVDNFGAD